MAKSEEKVIELTRAYARALKAVTENGSDCEWRSAGKVKDPRDPKRTLDLYVVLVERVEPTKKRRHPAMKKRTRK